MADEIIPEEWRSVEGWPMYEVSSLGNVRSLFRGTRIFGKYLRTWPAGAGYPMVRLCREDGPSKHYVHILVCRTFHGEPPTPEHEVAHWDDVLTHNSKGNLRWATHTENVGDRKRLGRTPAFRTKEQAIEVHQLLADGLSCREASERTKVPLTTVISISCGKNWRHLAPAAIQQERT